MSKPKVSSDWDVMYSPLGELFRVPPYTDKAYYEAKGYTMNKPGAVKKAISKLIKPKKSD